MVNWIIKLCSLIPRLFIFINRKHELLKAKSAGMIVGKNTHFVGQQYFGTEPYLISIGKNCLITDRVTFLNHDGGIQVPFIYEGMLYDDVYSRKSIFGQISIGDNCFIGVGAILLPGTVIGSNSIVGAGSLVRGKFAEKSILAGNPARLVSSIDKYFEKNSSSVIHFKGCESLKERSDIIFSKYNT